ncbi:MAG: multiheme c-type cytochrome [Betaproteobacteria bacterium]|nr:multiheme c-type cytochrome [Betaproteobacteria bacterium]
MPARAAFALVLAFAAALAWGQGDARRWLPLARDGLHDPASPGTRQLQEPREALSPLAPDTAGNQVRWVEALDRGQIIPRSTINPGTEVRILEDEILLNLNGGTPIVRFPHRAHTLWLDCSNCHEAIFKSKAGANKLDMRKILQGEQCGVCHGAVAFPLTECSRCHSVARAGKGPAAARAGAPNLPEAPRP